MEHSAVEPSRVCRSGAMGRRTTVQYVHGAITV